jgi:3-oxosteroid 1-dehydrogenase
MTAHLDMETGDMDADIVVLGTGAAGLSAALAAAGNGARVVILEKTAVIGGTTAMSGGGTWVPNNPKMRAAGLADSEDDALAYIRAMMPEAWREEEEPRWRAFVRAAPAMVEFVERHSPLRFVMVRQPDMFPEAPGGKTGGRLLTPDFLSRNVLGPWRGKLRKSIRPQLFSYDEIILSPLMRKPVRTGLKLAHKIAYRVATRRVGLGAAMIVGLFKGCLDHGCTAFTNARAEDLLRDGDSGRITGVVATIKGKRTTIRARKAAIIATGGFDWDEARLAQHYPTEWLLRGAPRTNTGDGQRMAEAVGAAFARMDQATIYPISNTTYEGQVHAIPLNQLDFAHCILVNRTGRRFVGEGDRNGIAKALAARDPRTGKPIHTPTWRIFDAQFAKANPFNVRVAGWVEGGLKRAPTIEDLARQIGLDPTALAETVARFNGFVHAGRDGDFGRGESSLEKFLTSDPKRPERNGALGAIARAPFYASPYYLGILGTKGGPKTNERGQVLRADGSVIGGLYAAGSAMANFFGAAAFSSGTTLGPYLAWGYVCGTNAVRENAE